MEKKIVRHVSEGMDYRGVGGLVKRLVHPAITGSEYLGVSIAYLNPGEEFPPHRHSNEEAYFVIQGTGIMTVEGNAGEIRLEKNLSVFMGANKEHYTRNTGDEPLVMLCSLAPPPKAM